VSGDSGSFASVGLHVGSDGWVTCHHHGDKTPGSSGADGDGTTKATDPKAA
jgi:hypothetical protein